MKALIFAAGLGTRLRPLTDNCPKALINVGGTPMLQHVIKNLKQAGVTEIVINVHHHARMITDYLKENRNFGTTIHVSDESAMLLDTGGGILKARKWLDGNEPFMVHNADILTDVDLSAIMSEHMRTGADATLLISKQRHSSRMLFFNHLTQRLYGWKNMSTGETRPSEFSADEAQYYHAAFSGIHIVSPSIFHSLASYSKDEAFPIIPYYLTMCRTLDIRGYEQEKQYEWYDIGKPATLEAARNSSIAR